MHRPTKQKQGDKHSTPVCEPGLGRVNRGCCAGRPGTVCAVRDGGTPRPWTVGWLGDCRVAGCTGEFRAVGGCVDGTTGSLNLYENTPSMTTPTRSRKPSAQGVSKEVASQSQTPMWAGSEAVTANDSTCPRTQVNVVQVSPEWVVLQTGKNHRRRPSSVEAREAHQCLCTEAQHTRVTYQLLGGQQQAVQAQANEHGCWDGDVPQQAHECEGEGVHVYERQQPPGTARW